MDLNDRPSPPTLSYEPATRSRPREAKLKMILAAATVLFGLILISVFLPFALRLWGEFASVRSGGGSVRAFARASISTCLFAAAFWAVCRAINALVTFERE